MNKMKRLTALLLALMMILSTFAAAEPAYQVGEMTSDDWQTIVDRAYAIVGTPTIDKGGVVVRPEIPDQPTMGGAPGGRQYLVTTEADLSEGSAEAMLYASGQLVLTGASADQWQINIGGDVWVNITGEAGETITVTNAMVEWLGDAVQVRQAGTPGNIANISIAEHIETMLMVAAVRSASAVAEEEVTPAAADDVQTLEEANQYTVTISYSFGNGDMAASPYSASLGKGTPFSATVENPVVPGYVATVDTATLQPGVSYDSEKGIVTIDVAAMTQNINVYVVYQPGQVKYTVSHYWQNVDNDGYTLKETTTETGTTGTKVPDEKVAKEYEGFYALLYEQPEIAADGSTTLEIYYDRYYRLMNFDLGGGYGVEPIYARFGTPIVVEGTPTKAGYEFKGWATTQENADAGNADATIPATMPSEHTKFYAVWKPVAVTQISVVFWGENADNEDYSYITTKMLNIKPGESFTFVPGDVGDLICPLEENHVHNANCNMTCTEEEHTHSAACYELICQITPHTHSVACYGDCTHAAHTQSCYTLSNGRWEQTTQPTVNGNNQRWNDLGNGIYTYEYRNNNWGSWNTRYYVKIGNYWYHSTNNNATISFNCQHEHTDACLSCDEIVHAHTDYLGACYELACEIPVHIHTGTCYDCGIPEHTHTAECRLQDAGLNSNLWTFVRSETVTVEADGSTVVNVYYDRKTFTLTFRANNNTVATITDKWGAYIADEFNKAPFNTTYNGRAWECTESSKYNYALQTLDRMPQFNATFNLYNKSSNTLKTIYYYVEKVGANVSANTWPTNANNFTLLKEVDTYFNYATYEEEYHLIEGFTRYTSSVAGFSGNQKNFSNNRLNLYYLRNSYNLVFNNGEENVKTDSVEYQASLAGYADYELTEADIPSYYEPGSVEFGGWYLNPECSDDAKVEFTDALTMPAGDIILYAKWTPKTYTVNFYLTEDTMNQNPDWIYDPDGDGDTEPATFLVEHGGNISEGYVKAHLDYDAMIDADPFDPYNFVAWFYYDENGVKQPFDPTMQIRRNLNLFAEWTSDFMVSYTINYVYVDANGKETVIAAPTTGSALGGTSATFDAKGGTELYPDYQVGYFPHTESHTLVFNETNEDGTPVVEYEYTFKYTSKDAIPYWVYYVTETQPTDPTLAALGTVELGEKTYYLVHATKTVAENKMAVVTENFEAVNGYMPDAFQKRLVVTPDGDNTIIFYYTKDEEHAYYQVTHYIENIDGGWTEYTTPSQIIGNIGMTDYADDPMNIAGFTYSRTDYVVNGEIIPEPDGYALTSDGLAINLYYTRNQYPYVVHYYLQGDETTKLAESKFANSDDEKEPYGKLVNESAIEIPGYEAIAPTDKSITIAIEESNDPEGADLQKNVIKFYYWENRVTINYVPTPATGGKVSLGSETIGMKTGVAAGSTATANEHYTFKGWYTDAECTKPVTTEGVLSNNGTTFVPTKAEDALWTSATYYAKFEENKVSIEYIAVLRNADGTLSVQNATGGTVNQKASDQETVPVVTGTPKGATAAAKTPTYKFVGWYSDEKCETETLVSTDAGFVPGQVDGVYVAAKYYALFELDVADLTITKTVEKSASGATAPTDDKFTIQVKLTPASGAELDEKYSYTKTNGTTVTEGELTVSDGTLTLSEVKDGDVIVIKGIVIGTSYKVSETEKPGYYIAAYTNAEGAIAAPTADSVNRVGVTNTYQTGHLTITKTVTGIDADDIPTNAVYNFTVTNSNGVSVRTINLAHGQSETISNLPIGDYTVTEGTPADIADYTFVKVQANGTDSASAAVKVTDNSTVTVPYTNVYKKNTASLTVEKNVVASTTGTTAPAGDEFKIKITFTAKQNSAYGLPTTYKLNDGDPQPLTNGAVELPVKAGDKITFPEVVIDTQYTVEETSKDGYYEVSYANAAGTIAADAVATVTNTYKTGSLKISKVVEGDTAPDDTFTFTLALSSKHETYSYTKTAADGTTTNDIVASDNGTVKLKAGESVTITGIPAGTDYTVTENPDADYITAPANATGTIKKDSTVEAAFTNTYQRGDLTITKQVVNNTGVDEFEFTITLNDTSINGAYGPVTFTNGIGKTTLKAGESVTIKDLPKDVGYAVTEAPVLGYTPASIGAEGTIQAGKVSTAAFTNTYEVVELKITKAVVGNTAPADDTFNFTVTLTDPIKDTKLTGSVKYSIDGGETKTEALADGAFRLTLKKGQTATIVDLPKGVKYDVEEATDPDYTTEYDAYKNGTITTEGVSTTVTNTYQYCDLVISKRIDPPSPQDLETKFTFTLELSDKQNQYDYQITDQNGIEKATDKIGDGGTFELEENWKITVKRVPVGTTYKVTEKPVSGYAVYVSIGHQADKVSKRVAEGTIQLGTDDMVNDVKFINVYGHGSLLVVKNVVGSAPKDTFKFMLTVTDGNNQTMTGIFPLLITYDQAGDREETIVVDISQTITFQLENGWSALIAGLPDGAKFTVTEDADSAYTTYVNDEIVPITEGEPYYGEQTNEITGIIPKNGMHEIAYTNVYQYSTLTIRKDGMEDGESAIFKVEAVSRYNPDKTTTFTVSVPNKGSVTIRDLLIDSDYTITEIDTWSNRYAQAETVNGKISKDGSEVTITNTDKNNQWLHDEDYVHNDFSTPGDYAND